MGGNPSSMSMPSSTHPAFWDLETPGSDAQTISSGDYARKCRDLMAFNKDIKELGAETIFDLPRIVVIGGQSSGKSSLVEALSGINVPRDSGTCTRCPMVCTMSSNTTSWYCSIAIECGDNHGVPNETPTPFGPTIIDNKDAMEIWIRRAQAAVLSPHRSPDYFLNLSDAELRNNAMNDPNICPFSKNAVHVDVHDPYATDLSFVDLPGLIQNAEPDLIQTIRSLVEYYITGSNTLIVIAMPMNDDIEMMEAMVLAGRADPEKERTIGVLTKPDTLTRGATGVREKWKDVLEGRECPTKHGYYCVRLPDDEERKRQITPSEAQQNDAFFFHTTAPWNRMADRSRFGISNFMSNISALLVERIENNLPELRNAVQAELAECSRAVSLLPPVLDVEPSAEIIRRINEFCRDVSEAVGGDRPNKVFIQKNKARYLQYKSDIVKTAPDFRPFTNRTEGLGENLTFSNSEPRWLSDIRRVVKQSIGWELPGEIPFEATTFLIRQYTALWEEPSISCFNDVAKNLNILVKDLLHQHFGQYKELEKYTSDLTYKERDTCIHAALSNVKRILVFEKYTLFTQNFEDVSLEQRKWQDKYEQYRKNWLIQPRVVSTAVPQPLYTFPPTRLDPELEFAPPTWSIDEEIQIIAKVQAYFQIAYKRIIDYVPLTIEHELNQNFAQAIAKTLLGRLFKDSGGGHLDLASLLSEDPVLERNRKFLKEREGRLMRIKVKLENFRSI